MKKGSGYNKLRYRDAFDFPALGVAASLRLDGAKKIEALTIAVTAVLPHPYRADDLTAPLIGKPLTDSAIQQLCEQLRDSARSGRLPAGLACQPCRYARQ